MKELWKALIARFVYWLSPKPLAPIVMQVPDPPLMPGTCECEHNRCAHVGGRGKCEAHYPPDEEWTNGAVCACQIFILDEDNSGGNDPETPSPSELEKLYRS